MKKPLNVDRFASTPEAKLLAAVLIGQTLCFHVYHHNSYANNPAMLRSPKPLIMRDIFLTKSSSIFPNPLSAFYVPFKSDAILNIGLSWALIISAGSAPMIGTVHLLVCYVLGGLCSSFAYLFQGQISKTKLNSIYDCNASSTGAWCSLCALTWNHPRLKLPLTRRTPLYVVTVPFALRAVADEYLDFWTERPEGVAQLTNWGCLGGLFFGLIYHRLMLLRKVDQGNVNKIFQSLSQVKTG